MNGAGERTRTADLLITNQLLYQLSYAGQRRRFSAYCVYEPKSRENFLAAAFAGGTV